MRTNLTGRVGVLERAAFGYADAAGVPHPGFIARLCRLEILARILIAFTAVPALHDLGIPTDHLASAVQDLYAVIMHF